VLAIREGRAPSTNTPGWVSLRDQFRRGGYPVPDTLRIRLPLNVEAFLSNREMLNAAFAMARAKSNLRDARADMRRDALTLRRRVEVHLIADSHKVI